MKKLFVAIKKGDINTVKQLVEKKPAVVLSTAKKSPKSDHGQSPLQVAIKNGKFDIADYLIDNGADINFIEQESCYEWRMPVLHDAIRATIMRARFTRQDYGSKEWKVVKRDFTGAFYILDKLIAKGAIVDCYDSYGNSVIERAVLDARQILPSVRYNEPDWVDPQPLNIELIEDLTKVFNILKDNGANGNPLDRQRGIPLTEVYKKEPVYRFLVQ